MDLAWLSGRASQKVNTFEGTTCTNLIKRETFETNQRVAIIVITIILTSRYSSVLGDRIYWCDAGLNVIETANLDGSDRRSLIRVLGDPDIHPFDIGIHNADIYWSDWRYKKIIRMNKYLGREASTVGTSVFDRAGGLHIYKGMIGLH